MKLSELKNGESAIIVKISGQGAFRKRITEMGFVKGRELTLVKHAPLLDPMEFKLMDYHVSLRKSEADLIEIVSKGESVLQPSSEIQPTVPDAIFRRSVQQKSKTIKIALVGNPNCGKTSLFNAASGAKQKVGNYSGVTVDVHTAKYKQDGYIFHLTDLPGTYSLSAYSPEEIFVRKNIIEEQPDVILNIVDAANLERNLFLSTQLMDMNIPMVMALNMFDELEKKGIDLKLSELEQLLGVPMIPTIGYKKQGIQELFSSIIKVYEQKHPVSRPVKAQLGTKIEDEINKIQTLLSHEDFITINNLVSPRFVAIKLLEKDKEIENFIPENTHKNAIQTQVKESIIQLEKELNDDSETLIADAKYGFISGAVKSTYHRKGLNKKQLTETLDSFLTNKFWGFPIFIFLMWLMFQATFTIGQYPMDWIESFVNYCGMQLSETMPNGILKDLLIDGIIAGVGGIIIFLPNILILFLFISLMEDTGYIARAAFIMDRLMRYLGLHGKSFIPLVMGFGCNVPAVMATRTIEDKNNRLLTMLITPFMSCSARLPVYILLIGACFPKYPGTVLFSIYIIGIILAVLIALIFKRFIFKTQATPFVMELPPYRIPTGKSVGLHVLNNAKLYLQKMGGLILIASVIIWTLSYFPRNEHLSSSQQMENSYMGKMGKAIEPVIQPLGFDWKMGVSIITGMAAKEVVVSTMGVLYQADEGIEVNENSASLKTRLENHQYQSGEKEGQKVFTPLAAYSFMLFILVYFPCVSVIAAIKKESGGWKWASITMLYTTGLAWILSLLVFQIGSHL